MSILLCTTGKEQALTLVVADYANWTVRLFTNNHTPADSDTASTYTEATFSGYAADTCAAFGSVYNNGSNQAEADGASANSFTCNGGGTTNTVYGYFVTKQVSGTKTLLWAETLPGAPITMANSGDAINVTVNLTLNHP